MLRNLYLSLMSSSAVTYRDIIITSSLALQGLLYTFGKAHFSCMMSFGALSGVAPCFLDLLLKSVFDVSGKTVKK